VLGFVEAGVADGPTGMFSSEVVTSESLHLDPRNGNVVGRFRLHVFGYVGLA